MGVLTDTTVRGLLESAPDAMVITDDSGAILLVNAQTERLFGYRRWELLGEKIEVLVPERLRGGHAGHRRWFSDEPRARPMGAGRELYALHRSGHEFPVEISLAPLETADGTLVSAAVRDISQRKLVEAARRDAEQRFRHAFADSAIGMALVDARGGRPGRLLEVNDKLCEITGYDGDGLMAMRSTGLVQVDDAGLLSVGVASLFSGETASFRRELRYIHARGDIVWVDLTTSLIRDDAGHPLYLLEQVQDVTERKRFETQLQHLADHDPLTGLYNRRRFGEELKRELAAARRYGRGGAVLALDLDGFKYVNDALGHSTGDELIARVAEAFRGRLRETDVIARLGGDEFGVILPHADEAAAHEVAAALRGAVRDGVQVDMPSGPARVTVSIGIAAFEVGEEPTGEQLMVEADIALYEAKDGGRDRFAVYAADRRRSSGIAAGLTWADRLRDAIERERFVLHAQPILSLGSDSRPRHELLLRMVGDDGELAPPAAFLPMAERQRLAGRIDTWVVRQAIAIAAEQQRTGNDVCLEVNLSGRSIGDGALLDVITSELRSSGADPGGLCFEVTETAAILNVDHAKRFARKLQDLGCEFALDDFGAGFSSLHYLKHLAFDYVKIDGEFITGLPTSPTNQLIVKSVVGIAHGLGRRTIAEFVGDAETLDLLDGYGVEYAQGHYVARPAPLDALDLTSRPTVGAQA